MRIINSTVCCSYIVLHINNFFNIDNAVDSVVAVEHFSSRFVFLDYFTKIQTKFISEITIYLSLVFQHYIYII